MENMISATVLRMGGDLAEGGAPITAGADNAAKERRGGVRNTVSSASTPPVGAARAGSLTISVGMGTDESPNKDADAEEPVKADRF